MKWYHRLTALCLSVLCCVSLLSGCAEEAEGMNLSVCVGGEPVSLDPIYAQEAADQTLLVHLYENLMRVTTDENGAVTVTGGMAKTVEHEKNHDGTVTFLFRLRDAEWSDGRRVKASDFVYAWQRLADPASQSPYAELLSVVVGYDEARASGDMSLLQATAKNDTTLMVNLSGHYDWFLREVCTSPATMPLRQDVILQLKGGTGAWWSDAAKLVTNGPYWVTEQTEDGIVLQYGSHYYDEKLARPKTITLRYADSAEEAWSLYEAKEADVVFPLTETRIAELAQDESWSAVPELGVHTVLFNGNHYLLSDPLIRQAMSLAIDRNAVAALAGVTAKAAEGLVPFGVPENEEGDFRTMGGALLENDPEAYSDLCQQARDLLNEAGYIGGFELGELEYLFVDTGSCAAEAAELCRQWDLALGIRVTPRAVTEAELWTALRSGEYTLAGVELGAVGNDAECFLMDWTSDSSDNVIGYTNTAYDTLMAIIAGAADGAARMGCLHDAESLILSDYAMAPLYTHGEAWEVRETLLGVCRDARGWFSFSGVFERPAV